MWIDLHTHQSNSKENVLAIVNQFPEDKPPQNKYFSIGIHPWYIENDWQNQFDLVIQKSQSTHCLAIGECGLDKLSNVQIEQQKEVLIAHIQLAESLKKPMIIHCVRAYQELVQIKQKLEVKTPMIIHGFSKNKKLAQQLLQQGFYLSFGKMLMNNTNTQEAFGDCPNNRMFLETDDANINIQDIYHQAENLKKEELKNQLIDNVNRVFRLNLQSV